MIYCLNSFQNFVPRQNNFLHQIKSSASENFGGLNIHVLFRKEQINVSLNNENYFIRRFIVVNYYYYYK